MFILYPQTARFPLGQLFATPGVLTEVSTIDISSALARHSMGDWGELPQEDIEENRSRIEGGLQAAVSLPLDESREVLDHHGMGSFRDNGAPSFGILKIPPIRLKS